MVETTMQPFLFDDPERTSRPQIQTAAPLPMSPDELMERGWSEVDIVFVTGDAYVDSPSFANGLLARLFEADGFRVAVLSQPDWRSAEDFRKFGSPKLAFCISAGNMDSMINHYTANLKVRNSDAYSPSGQIGRRPDRATLAYSQRAREAFPSVPILVGGVEASLRRIAHYDYKSDKVRRSIALDAKADLLVYGMGERPMLEILRRLSKGESIDTMRDIRGTVYRLGKTEDILEESETVVHLPSFEDVEENTSESKRQFVQMTRVAYENLNPYCAKTLLQQCGEEAVVVNPPSFPLTQQEMDYVYALPFTRKPHPSYNEPIPAADVVKASIQTHRGCFGGCSFCALTAHQGKFIQSRSESSIVDEVSKLASQANDKFVVSDLSAPTANMYQMRGKNPDLCRRCIRVSCLCPNQCPNLNVDYKPYLSLLKKVRETEGVKSVFIASGIRTDLANQSPDFVDELAAYHTGGHLKTAPEHTANRVLRLMNKPSIENYEEFCQLFVNASQKAGKEQYLVPYLIAGYPGCTLAEMVSVAEYLKAHNIHPEQVQDFIPAPFQLATCTYYTGIDPLTEESVYVPRGKRERRLQRALLFYYDNDYYFDVKSALKEADREDLIGFGDDALIPPYPSKGQSLRQSSRVKRLIRKTERETQDKTKRREEFELREERSQTNRRVGRETSSYQPGGYRAAAREFAKGGSFSSESEPTFKKEWNPIEKKWEKVRLPEEERTVERSDRNKFDGIRVRQERPRRFSNDRPRKFSDDSNRSFRRRDNEDDSNRSFRRRDNEDDSFRSRRDGGKFDSFRRRNENEGEEFQRESRFARSSQDNRAPNKRRFGNSETNGRSDRFSRNSNRFSDRSDNFSSPRRRRTDDRFQDGSFVRRDREDSSEVRENGSERSFGGRFERHSERNDSKRFGYNKRSGDFRKGDRRGGFDSRHNSGHHREDNRGRER